ncbi:uncharacterized protein PHACADRAFT_55588, partial [Phanerochaete carnosa HHB-10118-sp]
GISGWLRQEYRELELLNEVTRLLYHRKTSTSVGGVIRKQVIYTYRQWMRDDFVPNSMPKHIKWSKEQP